MRTFVAVEIDNQEILNSIQDVQSKLTIQAKPVSLKNIHFTVLFLGEISDSMSQNVIEKLGSIEFQSFDVSIQGIGVFPKLSNPRIIWVETDKEGGRKLSQLASSIIEKLSSLGFKADKPFKPHLTIFRVKNKIGNISNDLKKYQSYSFGVQRVSEIKLKKSILSSDGPIYSDLQVVKAIQ